MTSNEQILVLRRLQERLIVERDRTPDRGQRDRIAEEVNALDDLLDEARSA